MRKYKYMKHSCKELEQIVTKDFLQKYYVLEKLSPYVDNGQTLCYKPCHILVEKRIK